MHGGFSLNRRLELEAVVRNPDLAGGMSRPGAVSAHSGGQLMREAGLQKARLVAIYRLCVIGLSFVLHRKDRPRGRWRGRGFGTGRGCF